MIIIPANINRANEYLLRLAKLFEQKMKTDKAYSFRQSLKFNPPPLYLSSRNNTLGKTRKRTPNMR